MIQHNLDFQSRCLVLCPDESCRHPCAKHDSTGCMMCSCATKLLSNDEHLDSLRVGKVCSRSHLLNKPTETLNEKLAPFNLEVGPTNTGEAQMKTVNENDNTIIKQNLEPNSVEIWTGPKDKVYFKIKCQRPLLDLAVEDVVQQFNRLARATGRTQIILDNVVGAPVVPEKLQSLKPVYDFLPLEFEEQAEARKPEDKNPKAFHNRLRKFRKDSGFGIIQLAEGLGINPKDYLEVELGETSPFNEEGIIQISDILKLSDVMFKKLLVAAKNS